MMKINLDFFTSGLERVIIDNNGSVGIGTSTPAVPFHVYRNNVDSIIAIDQAGTKNDCGVQFKRATVEKWFIGMNDTDEDLIFRNNGFDEFVITEAGYVGIGTDNPNAKLDVRGDIYTNENIGIGVNTPAVSLDTNRTDSYKIPSGSTAQRPSNPVKGYFRYNTSLDRFEGYGVGNAWGSLAGVIDIDQDTKILAESIPDEDKLRFYTAGNERMIIDNVGNIGIGKTNPAVKVDIVGDINCTNITTSQDVNIPVNQKLNFATTEEISSDGNNLNIIANSTINLDGDVVFKGTQNSNKVFWDKSDNKLFIFGDFEVSGEQIIRNTEVVVTDDPIIRLGGVNTPTNNDAKDRGIEFAWHSSSAKYGFFGMRRNDNRFIYIPDGTNTSEVYTGNYGDVEIKDLYATSFITDNGLDMILNSTKGIDISANGSVVNTDDINITATQSINITSNENDTEAIKIYATNGGISIGCTAATGKDIIIRANGSSINLISTEDATDAIIIQAIQGGIGLISNGGTADDDIDLVCTTSINLIAYENASDSINIVAANGGIDITATGISGEDIDINADGSSINITSTEVVSNAIVLDADSGGLDILASGGNGFDIDVTNTGGSINLQASESVSDAITIKATQGGIDIDAVGTSGEDIDITATGSSINLISTENISDAITLNATTGGIDISANGQPGEDIDITATGSSINLKSTESIADAITLETTAGGIKFISSGQNTGSDIYMKATKSISMEADEIATDAINISATAGGINILSTAQPGNDINIKSIGASVNIESSEDATDAIILKATAGGIALLSQGLTEGDDIDLISSTSINIISNENRSDSIVLNSLEGGIAITANGDDGQDIDITNTGGSINLITTQNVSDSIVLSSTSGGIDIGCSGAAGLDIDITSLGSSINLLAYEDIQDAITITSNSGGIDIKALGSDSGDDIDIESNQKINIISSNTEDNSIKLWANYGGIDIGCTGINKDIKLEAHNGYVRIVRAVIDEPIFNTSEETDYSIWIPFSQFQVKEGIWDVYRDATNGDFCWRKEAKEEVSYLTADITLPTRDNTIKGYKLTSLYLAYAIEGQDLKSINTKIIKKVWNPSNPITASTTTTLTTANSGLTDGNLNIEPIIVVNLNNLTEDGGVLYQVNVQLQNPGNFYFADSDSYAATSYSWKAFDGNDATNWESNDSEFPHWISYDMETSISVSKFKWKTLNNSANRTPLTWKIQSSNDGTTWTDVQSYSNPSTYDSSVSWYTYYVDNPVASRYVRWYFTTAYGSGDAISISEMHFWRTSTIYVQTSGAETDYDAYKAFDNDLINSSARLSSADYGAQWISYDFKSAKLISRYRIASNPPSDQSDPESWTIQVSTDNTNWTTVDTQTNQSIASNAGYLLANTYYEIPLNNQISARYIRLMVTSTRWGSGICTITEIEYAEGVELYVGKSVNQNYRYVSITNPEFVNGNTAMTFGIDLDCNESSTFKFYGVSARYNSRLI